MVLPCQKRNQWLPAVALCICILVHTGLGEGYDAIVVGGGAAGCTLAQTLVEGGKEVLLLERGGRKGSDSKRKETAYNGLTDNACIEVFDGDGVVLATGRCLGGATTYNQAVWIEEEPDFLDDLAWFDESGDNFFTADAVSQAYAWVRNRVAPLQAEPSGSKQDTYIADQIEAMTAATGLPYNPGTPTYQTNQIWRTHSIFQPGTNKRFSADVLLDEHDSNLNLKLNSDVAKIGFDCDSGPCTAKCVLMKDGERYCVKNDSGRIYLTAGAINTPALLMKSGIGPGGRVKDNDMVGQGFSDKPAFPMTSFFNPGFGSFGDFATFLELVFTKTVQLSSGNTRSMLVEDLTVGKRGDLIDFARFERILLPRYLRFSPLGTVVDSVLQFCNNELAGDGFGLFGILCAPFIPFYAFKCTESISGVASLISEPSSKGQVKLTQNGKVVVEPGYMKTDDDLEIMGATIRFMAPIFAARDGKISGPSQPDDACPIVYCTIQNLFAVTTLMLSYAGYGSSQFDPNWVGPDLQRLDDLEMGEKASKYVISTHHFAGTAALGGVVDGNFKVMGVEGLYIADASILPTTPRVNTMASVMMVARLAGLAFADGGS